MKTKHPQVTTIVYLHQCGLSPREIAERQGIPREEVEQTLISEKRPAPTRESKLVRPRHRFY